ncbi:glycosyltransferase family protein [Candidatus Bipolaricaulota bacterium]
MRIVYGVQSTGMGHLARFAALKPLFDEDGHELLIIVSGPDKPPSYFLDLVGSSRYERMTGFGLADDGIGGISKRRTAGTFIGNMPELLSSLYSGHKLITAFNPDLIVSDFDPITGSPMVAPSIFKVGISNSAMVHLPRIDRLAGLRFERFNTNLAIKLCTSGVDVLLCCHFYPYDESCLPPILRPDIHEVAASNDGHILVYHSFQGRLESIIAFAERHKGREMVVYGYSTRPPNMPGNTRFETDGSRFIHDLASCDTYVGTAGFQSICEAFYLGKKIVVQPIDGHYEQKWNAAKLEELSMGRWHHGDLAHDLEHPFNQALHEQLVPWYKNGAKYCYDRIIWYAGNSP